MVTKGIQFVHQLSNICLKVVGAGRRGTGATILLDIQRNRYLFNCEENVDRLFVEGNIPNTVDTLQGVFLTHPIWERFVSVPNYGTVSDTEKMSTSKPNHFKVYTAKPDVARETLKMFRNVGENWDIVDAASHEEVYRDSEILIRPIPVSKGRDNLDTAVAYFAQIRDNPPDLLKERLVEFGIDKSSRLLKELRLGNSIVAPDGRAVSRMDCVGSSTPGPTFLILECPSQEFIPSIIANEQFRILQERHERVLKVVVHIMPQCVLCSDTYLKWMSGFSKTTEHLIVLSDHKPNIPIYGYKMRCILNMVSPTFYPIKRHPEASLPRLPDGSEDMHMAVDNCVFYLNRSKKQQDIPNFQVARIPTQVEVMQECYTHIQDCFQFHKTAVFERQLAAGVFVNTSKNSNNQLQKVTPLEHFQSFIANNNNTRGDLTPLAGDPLIVFLGTASAGNTFYRNSTSVLIVDGSKNSYFFDCGSGTYMQLWDRFREGTSEILANLKFVFISHRHIDHYTGIARLLKERTRVTREKVFVFAPGIIREKLRYYSDTVEDLCIEVLELSDLTNGVKPEVAAKLSLRGINTVRVAHCYDAHGLSMVHREGWKVVYSGDTRPVPELARIGANADLLIHDATFGRGMERHATQKRHSTSREAIQMGRDMRAKFTVLTHFSHRYNKMPDFEQCFVNGNVAVAFDMMSVLLSHLPLVIAAQTSMREFVPKYIREASRMSIGDYQWESIDSWDLEE